MKKAYQAAGYATATSVICLSIKQLNTLEDLGMFRCRTNVQQEPVL